jgi:CHAT domain-containing protein
LLDLYRAIILCERAQYADARRLGESAREAFSRLGLDRREISCLLLLARVSLWMLEAEQAQALSRMALQRLTGLAAPQLTFQAHVLLGDAARTLGNWETAHESYNDARLEMENLRSHIQGDELKISFLEDKGRVYQELVELCLKQSRFTEDIVFSYIEQAKSRTLFERFIWPVKDLDLPETDGLEADRIKSLRRELNWLYRRLEFEQTSREAVSLDRIAALRADVRQKENSFVRILRETDSRQEHADVVHSALPLDPSEVRAALHEEAAILEYFQAGSDFVAAIVKRSGTQIVRLASVNQVSAHVRMLEFQLAKLRLGQVYPDALQAQLLTATRSRLQDLFQCLVRPLEQFLEQAHLVVVPHGVLHYVPFHALYDGANYMIDRFTMSVAPSAAIYTMCTRRDANAGRGALLLGVQDVKAPFIELEIQSVAAAVRQPRVFLGANATTEILRTVGRESSIIHIATHGVFRKDNPMFSAVRMGDGYMSFYDLHQFKLPAELLTLSGCGTGLSVVAAGDELLGLTRGLLSAGAQSLLLSLWDVHDLTTSEFMSSFYRHLGQNGERAAALRAAMLETRDRQPHPYFWAPFVLVGKALN